jgi:hypothetical protein
MSHFSGLVFITPKYGETNGMDDSLAKYDEGLETPEYRARDLSGIDRVYFLEHYLIKGTDKEKDYEQFKLGFIKFMRGKKGYLTQKQFQEKYPCARNPKSKSSWAFGLITENKERYAEYFAQGMPEVWNLFEDTYKEKGDDWNNSKWRKDENGVWAVYSEYNPNSKWDWYSVGGRWDKSIKTKSGEFVNMCMFNELDLQPYPDDCFEDAEDWTGETYKKLKEGFDWHYDSKNNLPFCIVIDGVWYEKGDMGWWGMTSNEMSKEDWEKQVASLLEGLPADTEVYNVDFHI